MIEILEVTQPVDTVGVLELLNIVPCTISGSGLSGEFGRVLVAWWDDLMRPSHLVPYLYREWNSHVWNFPSKKKKKTLAQIENLSSLWLYTSTLISI